MNDAEAINWAKENPDLMKLDTNPFNMVDSWYNSFLWARAKELDRISKLPEEEQKRVRRSQREFAKRMAS